MFVELVHVGILKECIDNSISNFISWKTVSHFLSLLYCSHSYKTSNINEPPYGKTNNMHRRKQRRRSALISALFSLHG